MKLQLGLFHCTFVLLCLPSCYSFVIQRAKSNYLPQTDVNLQSGQNLKFTTHDKNEELSLNLTKTKWEPSREYQVLNRIQDFASNIETQRIKRQETELPQTAGYGRPDDKTASDEAESMKADDTEAGYTEADDTEAYDTEADDTEADDTEADDTEADDTEADGTEADADAADVDTADDTEDDVDAADGTEDDVDDADDTEPDVDAADVKADDAADVRADDAKAEVKADDVKADVKVENKEADDVKVDDVTVEAVKAGEVKSDDVTTDDVTTGDVTTGDVTADDVTAEDVTTGDVTADDVTAGDVTADDVTADDVTTGDVTADDVTAGDVTADDVTADDVTADDVTTDDVTADDVTADDVITGDVTTGDVTTGDVTTGDVTTGDVTTGDGTTGDVTTGDGTAVDVTADDVTPVDVTAVDATANEKTEDTAKTTTDKVELPVVADDVTTDTVKVEDTMSTETDKVELPVVADAATADTVKADEKIKDITTTETIETAKIKHKHVEQAEKSPESDSSKTTSGKPLVPVNKNIEKTETSSESDGTKVTLEEKQTSLHSEDDVDNDKTEIISTNNKDDKVGDANQKAPIPATAPHPDTKINTDDSARNESPIKVIDMTKFVPSIEERVIHQPEQPKQEENPPAPAQIPAPPTVPVREQPKPSNQPNNRPQTHNPPLLQPKNKLKCPLPYVLFEPPQLPFRRQTTGQQNPIMYHVSRISTHFPNLRPVILYSEEGEVTPGGMPRNEYVVCILPSEDDIHDRSVLSEESKLPNADFQPNFRRLFKPNGHHSQPPQSEGKLHRVEAPKDHLFFSTDRPHEQHPGNFQFAQNQRDIGPILNIPGHPRGLPPHLKSNEHLRGRNNSDPSKHSQDQSPAGRGHNSRMPRPHFESNHQPNRQRTVQIVLKSQMPKNVTATKTGYDVNGNDYKPAIFYYQPPKAAQPVNNTSSPSNKMHKNKARLYSAASKRG